MKFTIFFLHIAFYNVDITMAYTGSDQFNQDLLVFRVIEVDLLYCKR
jgi:hypothetical protein